ncbi:MAG: FtsQ-type POTRA domain-containing protein [Atopobiaceae bacterium]|nr:FtsQ-type POTRA domain-containing protein [Atopobiaceae bacterium]
MADVRTPQERAKPPIKRQPQAAAQEGRKGLPLPAIIALVVAVMAVLALVALLVLSHTPVLTITGIDVESTEHISAESIAKLARVEEGTTLLNVDVDAVAESVRRNPWVEDVQITREFPDRLKIVVTERKPGAIVLMSSGTIAWYLGSDGTWIEPFNIDVAANQTVIEAAQQHAVETGCRLITDVPAEVVPVAGEVAADDSLQAVLAYLDGFTAEFAAQVVRFSAPNRESVSCTLESGVEVSLGAPTSISTKEAIVTQVLAEHPDQITYINVRVPARPSYREVGTESVQEGTGALAEDEYSDPQELTEDDWYYGQHSDYPEGLEWGYDYYDAASDTYYEYQPETDSYITW